MLVSAIEGHRLWASVYDEASNPMLAIEDRELPEVLGDVAGLRAIDVACGTGRWMTWLLSRGANVVGFDLCAEMLARAAAKSGIGGRLGLADAARLPVASESADLVLCSLAIAYFEDLRATFSGFARTLRRGGRLVIGDVHPASIASGSTRSFSVDDASFEMRHYAWSTSDLLHAAGDVGLQLEAAHDVCHGPAEKHFYQRAGMMDVYHATLHVPAIWIASWKRP